MPTTTNFGWTTPADTDLVKDGASAMRTLGNGIDTSLVYLKGGTTGQILSKTSNTDLAFTWINNDQGDLTAITAGTGISVTSGTGPIPTVAIDTATTVDKTTAQTLTNKTISGSSNTITNISLTAGVTGTLPIGNGGTNLTTYTTGDLPYASAANTLSKLAIGTTGQVLTVSGGIPTWATAASGMTLVKTQTIGTGVSSVTVSSAFDSTYDNYFIIVSGGTGSNADENIAVQFGSTSTGYYAGYNGIVYSTGNAATDGASNATSFARAGNVATDGLNLQMIVSAPNLAKRTFVTGSQINAGNSRFWAGYINNTTQYTAFTITPSAGTLTGGTIKVYGFAN